MKKPRQAPDACKKKAPPEGGAYSVEAGFIQARNLSSSEERLRNVAAGRNPEFGHRDKPSLTRGLWHIFAILLAICAAIPAAAGPSHGLAMYGEPALPQGFAHLPYVNPDAPEGGTLIFPETGA